MRRILFAGAALIVLAAACGDNAETDSDDDTTTAGPGSSSSTSGSGGGATVGSGPGGAGTGGSSVGGSSVGGSSVGGSGTGGSGTGGSGTGGSGTGGAGGSGTGGSGGSTSNNCLDAEDCANNGSQICDQPTETCMAPQCSVSNPTCTNSTDTCLIQFPNSNNGACYPSCAPFSATCAAGQECLDLVGEGLEGVCLYTGNNTLGQSCTLHDINTDCVAGQYCGDQGNGDECLQQCNFWGPSASCTAAAQSCYFFSVCIDTPSYVDTASVGGLCGSSASAGDACAKVGDRILGSCQTNTSNQLECMKNCRVAQNDCNVNETCTAYAAPFDDFGVCE